MCNALNYLEVALDDLNVFSPNVYPLKTADRKCLSHAHAYRLAEANGVWGNRLLRSRGGRHRNAPIYCNARVAVHDRFKQSNKTYLDDAKTEVTRYLDEARIEDEYLDLLNWWKVNSSQFKIISQVGRDINSIPILTVPSEFTFSTKGRRHSFARRIGFNLNFWMTLLKKLTGLKKLMKVKEHLMYLNNFFVAIALNAHLCSGLTMQFSQPFSLEDTIKMCVTFFFLHFLEGYEIKEINGNSRLFMEASAIKCQVVEMGLMTTSLLSAENFQSLQNLCFLASLYYNYLPSFRFIEEKIRAINFIDLEMVVVITQVANERVGPLVQDLECISTIPLTLKRNHIAYTNYKAGHILSVPRIRPLLEK
uniref:HAT C-terminal dimerisation domain-containing protein n=1 Tax=Cucumis melo TaxID=3656 RepID=A0A9I9EKJ0_CUCME